MLLAGDDSTTRWPISKPPLVAKAPHHDVAFEEEGWLQADAKLLGTRACDVTGREGKAERSQRPSGSVGRVRRQLGEGSLSPLAEPQLPHL